MASLVNTFPQAFLEVLHHSLQHGGRKCCHFMPDVLFQIHRYPWFLFVHLALEMSPKEEVLRLVPMNIAVPTKYLLSQERIVVFENCLHSESPMLYRPELHGNWNALSPTRRGLKDKFVHLVLEIYPKEEVLRLGTLVPMNIAVPTKYPLSQYRIVVFENCLHS